jgi:hypothetical protein
MPTMLVSFPGGKRVDAEYGGFTIRADQSPDGAPTGYRVVRERWSEE